MSLRPRKVFTSASSARHPYAMPRSSSPRSIALSISPSSSDTLRASPTSSALHFSPTSSLLGPRPSLEDVYSDSSGETDDEKYQTECKKAKLVLDAARANRKVRHAEKYLADCVLEQHAVLHNLYRFNADIAEKKLENAEMDVGRVRLDIQRNKLSLCPTPPQRRPNALPSSGM
ncbi:hypothetical protein BV22DRAFT_1135721 [Leucogyrophana mollusca]|uniref:Uncharacterized protein n=1 Tax=Leucogyrophana mollusca TaxID=85980 RepID=A0ACB8AVL1_9AGAM|nr:hypothetical protein BV22DRAFT_1135721 [Leucogyrophana mollusca]